MNGTVSVAASASSRASSYIFFDMEDQAQIPVIAEPLFQQLQSKVEFIPVMNVDDLQRGLTDLTQE